MKIRDLVRALSEMDQDEEADLSYLRHLASPQYALSSPTHEDFNPLLSDLLSFVKEHPGATILPADDPSSLLVGFAAFVGEGDDEVCKFLSIRVHRLKPAIAEHPYLASAEGRRDMCGRIMSGSFQEVTS